MAKEEPAKGDNKEGTNGSRHYRSNTGSDYIEPTHHSRGDFSGWVKISNGKRIPLAQARYVDLATAKRILSIYGRDATAIKQVYDPTKQIDHDNVRGIVLYTLPGIEGVLQPSQIIEFIKPDIPKRAKQALQTPSKTKSNPENLGDPLSGIEEALRPGANEDSGLNLVPGTSSKGDTEILPREALLEEIAQLEEAKKGKKTGKK